MEGGEGCYGREVVMSVEEGRWRREDGGSKDGKGR